MPKIIKDGVAYGDGVMVDTALDSTSENPVQNKVITGEINDIKSALTDIVEYSSGEKVVGKWFNKTLYCQSFEVGASSSSVTLDANVTYNNAKIVRVDGGCWDTQQWFGFRDVYVNGVEYLATVNLKTTGLVLAISSNDPIQGANITVYYTKTP